MASHAPPSRTRADRKATDRAPVPNPETQRPRCLGPAAQLAAVHRTLRRGAIQPAAATAPAPPTPNRTGLPDRLKTGVEALSGVALDDVRVHRNSGEPAKLGALAYTRGSDIHVAPGQDEHLPHEAWHVVQQKQGRVRATAQMKGAPVSDDRALEAEADRLGGAAVRGAHTFAACVPARAPVDAVIQRKVKDGDVWLKGADPVSATLRAFIEKDESYMLRDDYHARLMDEPVHLIDMSKKYLLGETHGESATAKWNADTSHWSRVDKMFEWNKALPRGDRAEVGLPPEPDLQDQSLESRHAYLLLNVLQTIDEMNTLGASWVKELWNNPEYKQQIAAMFGAAEDMLVTADYSRHEYEEFIKAYEEQPDRSARALIIYNFAVRFRDIYHPGITKLTVALSAGRAAVEEFDTGKPDEAAKLAKNVADSLHGVATEHGFLRDMAVELIAINEIAEEAERGALTGLLAPTDEYQGVEMLDATNPARERGMADNVTRAAAPLLVKLGNDHLAGVKALVGVSAVAVDETEHLEKETKKP